ncbi:MAG: FAD-binding protein [Candidatus Sulfotelmatobacter sp.]
MKRAAEANVSDLCESLMNDAILDVYRQLSRHFKGSLLRVGDPEYHDATRIWNGMFARRPGLIAGCHDVHDVRAAVRAAAASGVNTAVRCGGHSLAGFGTCDDGLVIDLSHLREVGIDSSARKARFGGGCLLGTVDAATQKVGLAFPAGVVSHTGAGGLVLGGGTGWLNRLHGLSCDNVEGFTLVAADGSVLRANAKENPDLFWGLRGGGGNFGVVTEFEVKLHPVTSILFGRGLCIGDSVAELLRAWREFMPEAPDNLRWGFSLKNAGNRGDVPRKIRGLPVAIASALWVGNAEEGSGYIDHALTAADHEDVRVGEMTFLQLQTMADADFPHGRRYYTKSGYFRALEDEVIQTMIGALAEMPSAASEIELAYLGGAAQRLAPDETAFGDRSAPFVVNILSNWADPSEDDANFTWARKLFAQLRPAMVPGVYVNFMSGDEQDRVPEAYHERWERLRAIKTTYDPKNLFRLNQNIPPYPTVSS